MKKATTHLTFIKLSGFIHVANSFARKGFYVKVLSSALPNEEEARARLALKKLTNRELAAILRGNLPRGKAAKITRIMEAARA